MQFSEKEIKLKDGRTAVLKGPKPEDAAQWIYCYCKCREESPFLLNTPDEISLSMEQELAFMERIIASDNEVMIACFVDGIMAGNCCIKRKERNKNKHRATVAIALLQKFWNLGIGTAMFREMIQIGLDWDLEQLELEYIEGNDRGKALYEKMGFQTIGYIPNAIHQPDGTVAKEYRMLLML